MDKIKTAVLSYGPPAAFAVAGVKVATALTGTSHWLVRTGAAVLLAGAGLAIGSKFAK